MSSSHGFIPIPSSSSARNGGDDDDDSEEDEDEHQEGSGRATRNAVDNEAVTSSSAESTASRLVRLGLENRRSNFASNLECLEAAMGSHDINSCISSSSGASAAAAAASSADNEEDLLHVSSSGIVLVEEEGEVEEAFDEELEAEPSNFQPWFLRSTRPKPHQSVSGCYQQSSKIDPPPPSQSSVDNTLQQTRRNFMRSTDDGVNQSSDDTVNNDSKVRVVTVKTKESCASAQQVFNDAASSSHQGVGEAMNEYWSKFHQAAAATASDGGDLDRTFGDNFRRVDVPNESSNKDEDDGQILGAFNSLAIDRHHVRHRHQQQQQHHLPAVAAASVSNNNARRNVGNNSQQQQQQEAVGMYNWQSTKMTVKERLAFMFNNEILADVHFIVGKESQLQRIPAHRFVLSVGSAVFDAMFNSVLANKDDEISLPDVEPASFLGLLRFLYSDEVQIGPETVMTTLYTAKKYAVPALEKHCVDFLKRNLGADNAFMLLTQARLFDEPQLAALCLETIDKYTPEALSAEGFIDIDIDTLSAVLDRDSLRIKEAKLFSAVLRWSEAECHRQGLPATPENKRSVLGHVLTKIRFPLMAVEEFAQGPAQSGILSDRECVSLFLHFTVNPKPPVAFLDVPRCSMTGKEQTVCRFQQIESRWGYSGTSDKIRFIVDRRIFVVGFGLYGSIHGPSEYSATIQLFHTGSGRLLGSNEVSFLSDGSNSTFRVMFKEPIEIHPNTNYTSSATLKGLDSHYGTKGMRKVWVDCPVAAGGGGSSSGGSGGKVTFQFSYAAGNNNGTSVEDGQIPEIIFYT